jgi:N-acetylmuramoyl-L-alanine amidase
MNNQGRSLNLKNNQPVGNSGSFERFEQNGRNDTGNRPSPRNSTNKEYHNYSNNKFNGSNTANENGRKSGRKRKNKNNAIIVVILFLVILSLVSFVIYKAFFAKDNPSGESSLSTSAISSSVSSSAGESNGSSSVSASSGSASQSGEFWGNTIDFSTQILPLEGSSATIKKWPAEPGFVIEKIDISSYLSKKYEAGVLSGITVILDPGHGGEDLGAVYPRAPEKPQIIESKINLIIATLMKEKLEKLGATVVLTRTDNSYNKLYYRAAVVGKTTLTDFYGKLSPTSANRSIIEEYISQMDITLEANNDEDSTGWFFPLGVRREIKNILDLQSANTNFLFISLHCNASEQVNSRHGTYVYYTSNSVLYADEAKNNSEKTVISPEYQNYDDAQRKKLATLLYDNIISDNSDLVPNDPGNAIISKNYCVIREQNLVSALIELGYVNHTNDRAYLLNPSNQGKLSESIVKAIYEYYCVK